MRRVLRRLGIERKEARAWALYDWANSAYYVVMVTAIFPIYYEKIVGAGLEPGASSQLYVRFLAVSTVIAGLCAPVVGAIADSGGARKRLLALFTGLGVLASAALFFVDRGEWLLGGLLMSAGNLGIVCSIVCYDGLLAHVSKEGEADLLSTTGYGLGYLGGGLLLALNLAWIQLPEWFGLPSGEGLSADQATLPTRLAFLSVALWWAVFSIPLFLRVEEPPRALEPDESRGGSPVAAAFRRLGETFKELRGYRDAFLMLLAALVYGEGIGTLIKLAVVYASDLELEQGALIKAIMLTQFVGIPCAILFGKLAERIGARPAIFVALVVYTGVCVFAFFLDSERDFLVMAITVGVVQGGAQGLTRSLYAGLIPLHKSGEFFGLFAFASKIAGFAGPVLFVVVGAAFGTNRPAILVISLFFVAGGVLLSRVDIGRGRAVARQAERDLRVA